MPHALEPGEELVPQRKTGSRWPTAGREVDESISFFGGYFSFFGVGGWVGVVSNFFGVFTFGGGGVFGTFCAAWT